MNSVADKFAEDTFEHTVSMFADLKVMAEQLRRSRERHCAPTSVQIEPELVRRFRLEAREELTAMRDGSVDMRELLERTLPDNIRP
jgi:hypothetical protein